MDYSITYYYERIPNAGGGIPPKCSRHHLIAYPVMFFMGISSLAYFKSFGSHDQNLLEKFIGITGLPNAQVNAAINDVTVIDNKITADMDLNPQIGAVISPIAWIGCNLFIGPGSSYRNDDPSQLNDKFPVNMPAKQKKKIFEIQQVYKQHCKSALPHSSPERGTVHITDNSLQKIVTAFINNMSEMIKCGTGIYDSVISDWGAMEYNSENKTIYRIFFPNTVREHGDDEAQYAVMLVNSEDDFFEGDGRETNMINFSGDTGRNKEYRFGKDIICQKDHLKIKDNPISNYWV